MRTDADDALAGAKKNTLPDKPSELIRVALFDLEACERDPLYRVEMDDWHAPKNGVCEVCLAGATLAKRFNAPRDEHLDPGDFGNDVEEKLYALNEFRVGFVASGLGDMGLDIPDEMLGSVHVPDYRTNPDAFKVAMRAIANELEDHGL